MWQKTGYIALLLFIDLQVFSQEENADAHQQKCPQQLKGKNNDGKTGWLQLVYWLLPIAIFLLLPVIVFTAGKKDLPGIKRNNIISCGPLPLTKKHNSGPADGNSGNGCSHQTVSAACLSRVKRNKTHFC